MDRLASSNKAPGLIYELPVRAFTALREDIPQPLRGTLRGLMQPGCVDHLLRLGVSHVELMPINAWMDEPHLVKLGLSNAWGYNPQAISRSIRASRLKGWPIFASWLIDCTAPTLRCCSMWFSTIRRKAILMAPRFPCAGSTTLPTIFTRRMRRASSSTTRGAAIRSRATGPRRSPRHGFNAPFR